MNQIDLARRQLLLQTVQDSAGRLNTRAIDTRVNIQLPPGDLTVLSELKLLETEGKIRKILDKGGKTRGWDITEAGSAELKNLLTNE